MSESGYQEIDLDNPGKVQADAESSDIEIVEDSSPEPTPAPEPEAPSAAASSRPSEDDDHDDDDASSESPSSDRKKLTRSQRLKNQRDAYARQLNETQARLAALEARAQKAEAEANEGASLGFDLYIRQLDTSMQALRRDFDAAFDAGDRDKIFEVQQQIAAITAAKAQAEKDRRTIPTREAPSGQAAQPQTQRTPPPTKRQPSPAAMEWYDRNKEWFNKDAVMTAGARAIDQQMVADGYAPNDPDYFDELDRRLQKEFPQKYGRSPQQAPARSANNPTIQNRSAPTAAPGKVRVVITQEDRNMANHLGVSVEQYAREKARIERAQQTASQYTEIL